MADTRIKALSTRQGGSANRCLGRDGFVQAPANAAPKELKLTGIAAGGGGAVADFTGRYREKEGAAPGLTHLPGVELLSKREEALRGKQAAARALPVH